MVAKKDEARHVDDSGDAGASDESAHASVMPFAEADLHYFELARGMRGASQPGDAEFTALVRRARALQEQLASFGAAAHASLASLRDDLQLSLPTISSQRVPTYLSLALTRRQQNTAEDAQLYMLLREEGLELGFGFGVRPNQRQRDTKDRFTRQFQRHHRKARRYCDALQHRDYRLWTSPNQPLTTPTQPYEVWRQSGGAVVRILDRGVVVTSKQELVGAIAQVWSELLGMYGFLDRVYTQVPTIRSLEATSPEGLEDGPIESELHDAQAAAQELLLDFHAFAHNHQLHFPPDLVRAYTLSLQTRPLTILSGVAGTGKSKLALRFAEFVMEDAKTPQGNPHIAFVPVRPDWLDPQALLGYYDTLSSVYRATPFLHLLLRAAQDPDAPYFAILDEMNLARIEYYFSDLLSLLESRHYDENGVLVSQAPLHLHDAAEALFITDPYVDVVAIPARLPLPPNLYITGTINIDETTHRLSPKVLDRANLLEVTSPSPSLYLEWLCSAPRQAIPRSPATIAHQRAALIRHGAYNAPYKASALTLAPEDIAQLAALLDWLFAILQEAGFSFGLRLVQELLDFAENSLRRKGDGQLALPWVLDQQLMQKILPRLHGPRQRMQPLLARLLMACWPGRDEPQTRKQLAEQPPDPHALERRRTRALGITSDDDLPPPDLPKSARKIARMLTSLQAEPYVDFHSV